MKHLLILLGLIVGTLNAQTSIVYKEVPLIKKNKLDVTTLRNSNTENIHINIPDKSIGLTLHKVDILSEDFYVSTSTGQIIRNIDGVFYHGKLDNDTNSVASVAVYENEVVCTYSNSEGNFELSGQDKKSYSFRKITPQKEFTFECSTLDAPYVNKVTEASVVGCRAIQIYFEADYKLYQDKGSSVVNSVNYITALFNQVAMLYANEQITVQISQIKVWNTPDPYTAYTNTASVLNAFRTNVGSNFNGNLAHFLSTRSLGGGIAYVDVLCFKSYAFGVSAITPTFQNIPTYSWSVEVITHELGHNIGSWHTQSCNWPNGALDNCYPTEGGCPAGPAPVNGGTIMSYCHLTSYGINFSNGFGTVPGNYIRSKYNTATCLSGTSAAPTGLQTINITNTTATLQWIGVSGAQSYTIQYKQVSSTTWNTLSVGLNTSFVLTGLTQSTQYQWQVKTDCSNYTSPVTFTTTSQGTGCNVLINPSVGTVTQSSAFIYWVPIAGETAYHLQYKTLNATNWIEYGYIPTNSLILSNLVANTTYVVRVRPNCNINFGYVVQFTTLPNTGTCLPPINVQTTNITASSATFSWQGQSGSTSYQIQLKFPGSISFFTLGSSYSSSSVNFYGFQPSSTYQWRVKSNCSDWSNTVTFTTPANFQEDYEEELVVPNPTADFFQIKNVFGIGNLFNMSGIQVGEFSLDGSLVDISYLPSGIYYLKVNGKVFKVVKM